MFRWTNEFGFIRDYSDEWVDANGLCHACQKVERLSCFDDHGRAWCSPCLERAIDISRVDFS